MPQDLNPTHLKDAMMSQLGGICSGHDITLAIVDYAKQIGYMFLVSCFSSSLTTQKNSPRNVTHHTFHLNGNEWSRRKPNGWL